ncbi:response regulator transcription factor [Thiorhodovibrio winogradskyi]|uniref:response regulator transcription factor n=1 Tax=Thiorhodovibrio winogradskyi TaxID=77007 RepID=UPI002E28546C|nr:response regulator transcription factor [Thiorhodovibrio winogradskyi]
MLHSLSDPTPTDPARASLAIVEDEAPLRDNLELFLRSRGYAVCGVGSAEALYKQLATSPTQIIIVDIGLPGEDGFSLIEHLAAANRYGLIALTARGATADRIQGLQRGADLYFVKPVDLHELEAGIESLWRRLGHASRRRREDQPNPWILEPLDRRLRAPAGQVLALTARESELLDYLMSRPAEIISKDDLLCYLSGSAATDDFHRIEALLYRLRKKAMEVFAQPLPVRAVFGRGISFVAAARIERPL